jgi:hypothetical protein
MSSDVVPKVKMKTINSIECDDLTSDILWKMGRQTRGLYDTGADENTTNDPFIIHNLRLLDEKERITLYDAGSHGHVNKYGGESILNVGNGKMKTIPMKFTPSLKVTAIDPSKLKMSNLHCIEETQVSNHMQGAYFHRNRYKNGVTEIIPLHRVIREDTGIDRYYTLPFVKVPNEKAKEYVSLLELDTSQKQIQARSRMNKETIQLLWHFRLCHIHDGAIAESAKHTIGIKDYRPRTSIEKCDTCLKMRIQKASKFAEPGKVPITKSLPTFRRAPPASIVHDDDTAVFFQHLHMDFGFMVSKRKNEAEFRRLVAHNGDTCYLAVQDKKTNFVMGKASASKVAPLEWLHFCLTKYTPWKHKGRTVRIDNGELFAEEFITLFQKFGYYVDTTGPDNSAANGKVERFHFTVKGGIKCMIFAVSWSFKYWNYAFYFYILIYNTTSHGKHGFVPYTVVSGKKYNHDRTRIFGSQVVVLKNGKRPSLSDHSRRGRYIGTSRTSKKILYVPQNNPNIVMESAHVLIDELNSRLKVEPPATIALRRALGYETTVLDAADRRPLEPYLTMDILSGCEQFARIMEFSITNDGSNSHGATINTDLATNRGYISDIEAKSMFATIPKWRIQAIGRFMTRINGIMVFSQKDIERELQSVIKLGEDFSVTLCSDTLNVLPTASHNERAIPQIDLSTTPRFYDSLANCTGTQKHA